MEDGVKLEENKVWPSLHSSRDFVNRSKKISDVSAGPHSASCIEANKQGAGWIQPEPSTPPPKCYACSSVGERTGQPLSLAKIVIPGADAVANAEGNTDGRVNAEHQTARRGRSAGTRRALAEAIVFTLRGCRLAGVVEWPRWSDQVR